MKGKTIFTAVLLAASFGFAACTGGGEENSISSETGSTAVSSEQSSQTEGGSSVAAESFDFKSIRISWNYCTAEDYVYEAETDGENVILRAYVALSRYKDGKYVDENYIYREFTVDSTVKEAICKELTACNAASWDGFSESASDVLDGEGFSLDITREDGSTLHAYGSNAWPDGFYGFSIFFKDTICMDTVRSADFENVNYSLELPESWVDTVKIRYQPEYTGFYLQEGDKEVSLLSVDVSSYGYEAYSEDDIRAGLLTEDGEVRYYVTVRNYDPYPGNISSAEGENIAAELPEDIPVIVESIKGLNGLIFEPESGGKLYMSDARDLFDKARSLWLNIFLAEEYPSGRTQIEENGRVYDSAFASYERQSPRNEEGLRELFLQYFTEEFTDYLMNKMEEEGDLIVRNNILYVPAVKVENNALYGNGYVKDVRKEDDGRYTVIVEVMKASPEDEKYRYSLREELEFPVERNEDGSYVFSAFPYWDRQY
ncbi:MAG: hypothetical protein IJH99_00335 [Eubacterium sp.]|nr:hypothetical protein [Eubacterium sp.]